MVPPPKGMRGWGSEGMVPVMALGKPLTLSLNGDLPSHRAATPGKYRRPRGCHPTIPAPPVGGGVQTLSRLDALMRRARRFVASWTDAGIRAT
jgi:hypothetical protein